MRRAERLSALCRIAAMKAELSLTNLAEAQRSCAELDQALMDLQAERDKNTTEVIPISQAPDHARWLEHVARRRTNLLSQRAMAEARRLDLLGVARREEGRRQVLDRIADQAS